MLSSAFVLIGMLVLASAIVLRSKGWPGIWRALRSAWRMLRMVLPLLLLGVGLAGLIQVLVPRETMSSLMGDQSGLLGVLLGTAAGMLIPGGPFLIFPIAASIYDSGAGIGPLAAFITAWSVVPLNRTVTWEIPFLGAPFAIARFIVSLPFPIIVGLLAPVVFRLVA